MNSWLKGLIIFAVLLVGEALLGSTRAAPLGTAATASASAKWFDVWQARAPLHTGRDRAAAALVAGKIVVLGGWDQELGAASAAAEAYDPAGNTWQTLAPMPTGRVGLAAAVAGNELYAIAGWRSPAQTVTGIVEVYDPRANRWRSAAPLPLARSGLAAVSVNERIYALGGWDGQQVSHAVTMYDPHSDRWTAVAPLPTARSGLAAAVVAGQIYAIGGFDGRWVTGVVEVYDPALDRWTAAAGLGRARWHLGAGVVHGRIFAVGGNEWHDTGAALAVNELYDPAQNRWRPAQAVPTERWGPVVVADGDWLAVIGGNDTGSRAHEAFRPFAPYTAFLPASAFDPYGRPPDTVVSRPLFQVFILSPVRTCLVGNEFASGTVCRGAHCGDCSCTWEEFDPPAPLQGVAPQNIDDPQYDGYAHKVCLEMSLTPAEIAGIVGDMETVRKEVLDWSDGALDLQMDYRVLAHDHTGFVAPDYTFGPFEVDDELLNDFVTPETDFVYLVAPVTDRQQGLNLAYACGGSYGEMSVRGAGFAEIQANDLCNSVLIAGRQVYEPLIHEWLHNLDWALFSINERADVFQYDAPDWANWQPGTWPACGKGSPDPLSWFPSIDFCEWDPDWIDCNNVSSAGACLHAGEVDGQMSWYEHVLRAHYPRTFAYEGNHCRDGRQDFGETGIDRGGPCP